MELRTYIKKRDMAIGIFFTQINMTFNKVIFGLLALFLAYGEWSNSYNSIGLKELGFFIYLFAFYIVLFLFLIGLFGVLMAVSGSVFKKGVLGEHIFEFNEKEFIESTEHNESHHKYSGVSKIMSRLGALYIGVSGTQWHILPKRDFESKEHREKLISFLREKISA